MTDPGTAQARELLRALMEQIHDMTERLARVDRNTYDHTGRSQAMRREASALRRDIAYAEYLIDQMRRRYPGVVTDRLSTAAWSEPSESFELVKA